MAALGCAEAGHAQVVEPLPASAEAPFRQSVDDAWFTGPMLANSAATLPRGRALIEPYIFDEIKADSNFLGSLTYMLYGVTDKFTIGAKPIFGLNSVEGSESAFGIGDTEILAQYRLTPIGGDPAKPAISVALLHAFPTGKFDRLGDQPAKGLGSGSHITTVALYGQQYFWLPNGRIFRARLNLSQSFPRSAKVEGTSVYGTGEGFRGRATPGSTFLAGVSGEYSVTKNFVLALDLVFTRTGRAHVRGHDFLNPDGDGNPAVVDFKSGTSRSIAIAPAVEYSWKPNIGVLLGTRFKPRGHNSPSSITPAVAINYVY